MWDCASTLEVATGAECCFLHTDGCNKVSACDSYFEEIAQASNGFPSSHQGAGYHLKSPKQSGMGI